jgi:hypothetical protein
MIESDPLPPSGYDTADDPRRVVLADLVARFAVAVAAGARDYERAAIRAEGSLRHGLEELARAKQAEAAWLAPLARSLGVPAPVVGLPLPAGTAVSWGEILGKAFQAERVLEGVGRELAGLTSEPAVRALATRLIAGVSRDRGEVRRLYLRYT